MRVDLNTPECYKYTVYFYGQPLHGVCVSADDEKGEAEILLTRRDEEGGSLYLLDKGDGPTRGKMTTIIRGDIEIRKDKPDAINPNAGD